MRKRIRLGIEDQINVALTQQTDIFRAMLPHFAEPQTLQPVGQFGALTFVHGEFEKLDAVVVAGLGWREQRLKDGRRGGLLKQPLAGFLFEVQQRTEPVCRIGTHRCSAKTVVEDFQR